MLNFLLGVTDFARILQRQFQRSKTATFYNLQQSASLKFQIIHESKINYGFTLDTKIFKGVH